MKRTDYYNSIKQGEKKVLSDSGIPFQNSQIKSGGSYE